MKFSKMMKGVKNPGRGVQHLAKKPFIFIDKNFNYGTNAFEKEWDLLVVLDACRYDLFAEFAPRHSVYELFDSVGRMYSIGSQTPDWVARTFGQADESLLSQTLYISDAGHAEMVAASGVCDVQHVEENTRNTEGGVLRPEPLTDEAIEQFKTAGAEKFIVHYVQPHAPFLHCVGKYDATVDENGHPQNVWNGIRSGRFDKSDVWEDYGQNLLLVLDHVERLLENFEGKVAVTADHGNALGEFGLYGHPGREAAPSIRRVPWAVATGQE